MKDSGFDPDDIIRTQVLFLMLCAFVRGYYTYRQHRLEALYGEDYRSVVAFVDEAKGYQGVQELGDSMF